MCGVCACACPRERLSSKIMRCIHTQQPARAHTQTHIAATNGTEKVYEYIPFHLMQKHSICTTHLPLIDDLDTGPKVWNVLIAFGEVARSMRCAVIPCALALSVNVCVCVFACILMAVWACCCTPPICIAEQRALFAGLRLTSTHTVHTQYHLNEMILFFFYQSQGKWWASIQIESIEIGGRFWKLVESIASLSRIKNHVDCSRLFVLDLTISSGRL